MFSKRIKCFICGNFRDLTREELLMMRNLPCYECNMRLKVVGVELDFSGSFYTTEPEEDESLDY